MLVDLHAHYPMHIQVGQKAGARYWMTNYHRAGFWEKVRAWLLKLLNDHENFPAPGEPAVTVPNLRQGNVGVVLSVLYAPFDEMDLTKKYAAPPEEKYLEDIHDQMLAVEAEIKHKYDAQAAVVHNQKELEAARAAGKVALIHAIEGGFQLGDSVEHISANVKKLAESGLGYVTVAHLFFRQVATNAPAIPFLPDWIYNWWFPQSGGLTKLGEAAIRAMVENHILIDLTHMSRASIEATLDLLDRPSVDPQGTVPVVATHSAYRFGKLQYNLTDNHILRIKRRKGVVGLIACDHYMTNGIRGRTTTFDDTMEVLRQHIDKIRNLTGDYSSIGIGTDLDGFIKPTLKGLEFHKAFNEVHAYLVKQYSQDVAEQIFSRNALRLLDYWGAKDDRLVVGGR
jgi:microsomal dipeptidase-like Zn-dependent dipeptidase